MIAKHLFNLFINREDCYAHQFLHKNGKKGFKTINKPITLDLIEEHLRDENPIGVYQLNKDNLVKWGALDFDKNTKEDFENAKKLYGILIDKGFFPLLEMSGGGDYKVHIWLFSKELIPSKQMRLFLESICEETKIKPHEIFPKQDEIPKEGYGNLVKLPLGINLSTNKKSKIMIKYKPLTKEQDIKDKLNIHTEKKDTIPIIKEKIEKEQSHYVSGNPSEFDKFFEYILHNRLPHGETSQEKIGDKEAGINNNILKNEAIWFYKKGYDLKRLTKEIKPIFDERKWLFGNLKGWFNKAVKGDLKEISKGEIIKWCTTYQPSLLNLIDFDEFLKPKDIKYKTDHLPNFELIERIIPLKGQEYLQAKKTSYDMLISLAIPEHLRIIQEGEIKTDMRGNPCVVMPSGKGKKEIKEGIKKTLLAFNPSTNIKEPRSPHKEQLVGKILKRKKKVEDGEDKEGKPKYKMVDEWVTKYGFLNADLLIFEEAHELFNSKEKNEVECRDALTIALDTYGENLIQKQTVDNLDTKEETLSYYPYVHCLSFTQPLMFNETFTTKGLQRRNEVVYSEFPDKTNTDYFVNRLLAKVRDDKSISQFAHFMKKINNLKTKWSLSPKAYDSFILYHKALLEQGFLQGGKAKNYVKILEYPLQNILLKKAGIRALSNLRTDINEKDVENAFIDIIERFVFELIFVDKKVKGKLDYGNSWAGATGNKQKCLEWLWKQGATDKESSTTFIRTFQGKIADTYDLSLRRAKDRYSEMKEEELIEDWLGQGKNNKVWLKIKPTIEEKPQEIELSPKRIYLSLLSGMSPLTDMSGMTIRQVNPYETNQNNSFIISDNKKGNNNSIGVIPDTPDIPVLSQLKEGYEEDLY